MRTHVIAMTVLAGALVGVAMTPPMQAARHAVGASETPGMPRASRPRYAEIRWTRVGDVLPVQGEAGEVYVRLIAIDGEVLVPDTIDEAGRVRRMFR